MEFSPLVALGRKKNLFTLQQMPTPELIIPELIIFDCDGVLVDSEPLSLRCLCDALAALGFTLSEAEALRRYLGVSLKTLRQDVEAELGRPLSEAFLDRLQCQTLELFRQALQPMPGVADLLEHLRSLTIPVCVASSSTPERIRLALKVTGMLGYFEPDIFSASMVRHGKPAPDLFLLAAQRMNIMPERCLVIEDSANGVRAGRAAGMAVVGFTGGGHVEHSRHRRELSAAGAQRVIERFSELPPLLV